MLISGNPFFAVSAFKNTLLISNERKKSTLDFYRRMPCAELDFHLNLSGHPSVKMSIQAGHKRSIEALTFVPRGRMNGTFF